MANTYTQIHVQIIFSVAGRQNLISERIRERVEKYMCGIISANKSKPLAIYCNPDHVHILIGLHPSVSVSDMAKMIKANSSKWINENRWIMGRFNWQGGFGAFTYSKSDIDRVVKYILNQPQHHQNVSFQDEYKSFLEEFGIVYDPKYLFDWND